jgi:hypothetical protein
MHPTHDALNTLKDDKDSPVGYRHILAKNWRDIGLGLVLSLGIAVASYQLSSSLPAFLMQTEDLWFHADQNKVSQVMSSRESQHHVGNRSRRHPLFPLLTFVPVYLIKHGLSVDQTTALRVFSAAVVSVWIVVFFALLRLIGCRRPDAALFTLLASSSASSIFWFIIPESFGLGSLSLLCAFVLVALAESTKLASGWYVAANALSFSVTTTNWMAGILSVLVTYHWKRALRLMLYAVCLVTGLWLVQKALIPGWPFFFPNLEQEATWLLRADSGGPLHVVRAFLFHSMVMPTIATDDRTPAAVLVEGHYVHLGPYFTIQGSSLGSGTAWGLFAAVFWAGLLLIGAWAWFQLKQHGRFRVMLGFALLGQLMLHLFYGNETFLYSLHFMPLLILWAAAGTLTRARPLALALAALLVMAALMNNIIVFQQAGSMARDAYRHSQAEQILPIQ